MTRAWWIVLVVGCGGAAVATPPPETPPVASGVVVSRAPWSVAFSDEAMLAYSDEGVLTFDGESLGTLDADGTLRREGEAVATLGRDGAMTLHGEPLAPHIEGSRMLEGETAVLEIDAHDRLRVRAPDGRNLATVPIDGAVPEAHATILYLTAVYMLEAARTAEDADDEDDADDDEDAEPVAESEDDDLWRMPIDGAPSEGPADALVTIVEMTDFQCPYCARGAATMAALRERFPDDVRIVVRQRPLPFHENARPAATAALEARAQHGDAGFFRMAALLFGNQRGLGRATLERLAVLEGLDLARFRHALDSGAHDAAIARDMALGDRMGAEGTPTFYVNGELMVGAQPLASFVHAVERARARAQDALAAGASREHLYEALLAHARDPGPIAVEPTRPPPPAPSDVAHPPAGAHASEGGAWYVVEHAGDPDDDGASRVIRGRLASWDASGAVLDGTSPTPINVLLDGLDSVLAAALRGMRSGEIRRVWLPGSRVIWVEAVDVQ